ncbi:MAG: nucleoside recognition protein [Bacteroidales bacterium]|nr:nucleoside recognition protein [Bacteroidales bacterium]
MGDSIHTATPRALRTIWWIFRITAVISFVMFLLKYTGLLIWISALVSPVFLLFGLPGDAAMAYVSGYFINVYSCVAVVSTISLTAREMTILGAMTLAAHAIPVETAVQHKTGSPSWYCVLVRTLGSLALGITLNLLLPGRAEVWTGQTVPLSEIPLIAIQGDFRPMFFEWLLGLLKLSLWMTCLIWLLNVLQRILYEFNLMERISRLFRPLLKVFGLGEKTSFLWIVANVVGLSYGSAVMLDEAERGNLSLREINLLNTHIGISHSNLEDLLLVSALGGVWYVILLSRWILVTILVWMLRFFMYLRV